MAPRPKGAIGSLAYSSNEPTCNRSDLDNAYGLGRHSLAFAEALDLSDNNFPCFNIDNSAAPGL